MSTSYNVIFGEYTERHFIKIFRKKYKSAWELTFRAIKLEFENFDVLFQKSIAETIVDSPLIKICKTEFKIAGTQESRHGSGNRCIVAVHKDISTVNVLLVYHKNDLGDGNETSKWKQVIKDNYPDYCRLL